MTAPFLLAILAAAGQLDPQAAFAEAGPDPLTAERLRAHLGRAQLPPKPDLAKESFVTLGPAKAAGKPGLLVWVSPGPTGQPLPTEALRTLLDKHNLALVGANNSGNDRDLVDRFRLALAARHNGLAKFGADPARVIVAGFSGGGKVACMLARMQPDLFPAAIGFGGGGFHKPVAAGPNSRYPRDLVLTAAQEKLVRQKATLAFVTGPGDFNHDPLVAFEKAYRTAGIRVKLFDVPNLAHALPEPPVWSEAIAFVDPAGGAAP